MKIETVFNGGFLPVLPFGDGYSLHRGQPATEPNERARAPNPPRETVELFKLGARDVDRATWVRPIVLPTFLLSAVRKLFGSLVERYNGCDATPVRPLSILPIMYPIINGMKTEPPLWVW